jgi:hypothetical protein
VSPWLAQLPRPSAPEVDPSPSKPGMDLFPSRPGTSGGGGLSDDDSHSLASFATMSRPNTRCVTCPAHPTHVSLTELCD